MRERTATAEGTKIKGGAQRRIALTMDEQLFYQIRTRATIEGRTFSNTIVLLVEEALKSGRALTSGQ